MGAADFARSAADADGNALLVPLAAENGQSAAAIIVDLIGGNVEVRAADAQTASAKPGELVSRVEFASYAREGREWGFKRCDRLTEVVEGLDRFGVGERF